MQTSAFFRQYCSDLAACLNGVAITDAVSRRIEFDIAFDSILGSLRTAKAQDAKLILIGNGGSAAIASHIAFDFWKRAGIRATAFNDAVLLTASVNDFGRANMFVEPLKRFACSGDILIAISSSGQSENIVNAAREGRNLGCEVVTLSAFRADNPLRSLGDVNVYLATDAYGHAEIGHETILHALVDCLVSDSETR